METTYFLYDKHIFRNYNHDFLEEENILHQTNLIQALGRSTINRSLDQVVIGRKKVFNGAQYIYDYCQENLTLNEIGSKRSYYLERTGTVT